MPAVNALVPVTHDKMASMIECTPENASDDMIENPYIIEALRVLPVKGYRSAIGNVWNAVVDDLRNKIIHRSLPLFNKAVQLKREVKCYEDFQNFVNDDDLIEGAREIGVIRWEAAKILKHAKETSPTPSTATPAVQSASAIKAWRCSMTACGMCWPSRTRPKWWTSTTT